jgi:hypothetical protein
MGAAQSSALNCKAITNDYELVVKVSKQLEALLETHFGGTGRGLHEKLTTSRVSALDRASRLVWRVGALTMISGVSCSACRLPVYPNPFVSAVVSAALWLLNPAVVLAPFIQGIPFALEKQIRFLATIRNQVRARPTLPLPLPLPLPSPPLSRVNLLCFCISCVSLQLIHNSEVDRIPDRAAFVNAYETAVAELERLAAPAEAKSGSYCTIS